MLVQEKVGARLKGRLSSVDQGRRNGDTTPFMRRGWPWRRLLGGREPIPDGLQPSPNPGEIYFQDKAGEEPEPQGNEGGQSPHCRDRPGYPQADLPDRPAEEDKRPR